MASTTFGKILRKIRIDRDEVLVVMSAKLGIHASTLWNIENGKRSVPEGLIEKICTVYNLSKQECQELSAAAVELSKAVLINMEDRTPEDKELIINFSKRIDDLGEQTRTALGEILNRRSNQDEKKDDGNQ